MKKIFQLVVVVTFSLSSQTAFAWDSTSTYPTISSASISDTSIVAGTPFTMNVSVDGKGLVIFAVSAEFRSIDGRLNNALTTNLSCSYIYNGLVKSGAPIVSGSVPISCYPSRRLQEGKWYLSSLQVEATSCPADQIGVPSSNPCTNGNDHRHFTQYFSGMLNSQLTEVDLRSGFQQSDEIIIAEGAESARVVSNLPYLKLSRPQSLSAAPITDVSSTENQINFKYSQIYSINSSPDIVCMFQSNFGTVQEISSYQVQKSLFVSGLQPGQKVTLSERCTSYDGMFATSNYILSTQGTQTITSRTKTLNCVRGNQIKKVVAIKPKCPSGYISK